MPNNVSVDMPAAICDRRAAQVKVYTGRAICGDADSTANFMSNVIVMYQTVNILSESGGYPPRAGAYPPRADARRPEFSATEANRAR